jgi:hypothetical protein
VRAYADIGLLHGYGPDWRCGGNDVYPHCEVRLSLVTLAPVLAPFITALNPLHGALHACNTLRPPPALHHPHPQYGDASTSMGNRNRNNYTLPK